MAIEIRPIRPDEHETVVLNELRAFATTTPTAPVLARLRTGLELDRFVVGDEDGVPVSSAGAFSFRMTVPGGAAVPVAGVTWVTVLGTHRRRGLMRGMLDRLADDARARGEVAAILYAAEGSIYEHVGYGMASRHREVSIATRRAAFRPEAPSGGTVRYLDPARAPEVLPAVHDRAWRLRAGEVNRSAQFWEMRLKQHTEPPDGQAAPFTLVHHDDDGIADGFAVYTSEERWNTDDPQHLVTVTEFAAASPEAHAELWRTLCSLDLVGEIRTDVLPADDPLPYLLVDSRVVRTTSLSDGLWLKVLDVEGLFGARSYRTDDVVVIDAAKLGRWRVGSGGCHPTDDPAEVSMSDVELGSVSLGGASISALVQARRIAEHTPGAAARLSTILTADPLPYCTTHF